MGAKQALTKERERIISQVINDNGFTKKRQVREFLNDHKLFRDISARYFNDLIKFDFEPDIIDQGHIITGRSTLKGANGELKQEWVKTSIDKNKQLEALKLSIKELIENAPPAPKINRNKTITNNNLLNQYTIADYHFGMFAVMAETGEDFNTEIAEELLINWVKMGIETSPKAEECVLCLLGDFQHWDNIEPLTPTSKHLLDASTRFPILVRLTIRVIDVIISMLLQKYKKVNVIDAEGNHDISSSIWRRELFAYRYKDNERVYIDNSILPYYAFSWGSVALFYHHGHKKKLDALDKVFASYFKELYGRSKHIYAHTGHLHHKKLIESSLMILEQHPTLSTGDAHSVRGGYKSKRNSQIITYNKHFGEVARLSISPEIIQHETNNN